MKKSWYNKQPFIYQERIESMKKLFFTEKGQKFEAPKPKPTRRELLETMNLTPSEDYELFMKIGRNEYEPIQPDEVVDLTMPGIEAFRVRRRYEIPYELDDEFYSSYECFITPAEILKANSFDAEKFYLKKIEGNREITYKSDMNHPISLRPNDKFISLKRAATPVA